MSTLAYYENQLELFDPAFHEPLVITTAGRDIKFKGTSYDIEATSFLRNKYGATGSQSAQGFPWQAANGNNAPGISIDSQKVTTPHRLLERNVTYSMIELMKSEKTGQPIDTAKMLALNQLYQLDIDRAVYTGATGDYATFYGLVNNPVISTADVVNGASGFKEWTTKTPDEIVLDINSALDAAWIASGLQFPPNKVLIPPTQFSYITSTKVSDAGNISILNYIKINSISTELNGSIDIQPLKFLSPGPFGADPVKARMVVYTNSLEFVRFPLAPISGGPAWQQGYNYYRPYMYGFGETEFVYPETFAYRDGI